MKRTDHRFRANRNHVRKYRKEFELPNTHIVVEDGPALTVRIERDDMVEWGYVAPTTLTALEEVSQHGN